ncbi:MAG: molybdenum cofactor guanylyltransferase [Nitrospira sp.]|nr:molybdenum cofactor guanylyltransferase [Nitrospira sp.]
MAVTGVILAGGKSRRMGEDKRFLVVGEATLLARTVSVMTGKFPEVLIVIAQDSEPLAVSGCTVHRDLISDCGSLGGLYTGLTKATNERIFIVACDMPFLQPEMIQRFVDRDPAADIVMAQLPDGLQPLHALYGKRALPILERMAVAHELKIKNIALEPSLRTTIVLPAEWSDEDPLAQSFQNVNTPADLEAARSALRHRSLIQ